MDADELREWLVARVAALAGVPADAVPVDQPFSGLGLDSPRLAALAGELGARLGRPVDPSVAFEHPSIEELAGALATGSAGPVGAAGPMRTVGEPIAVVGLACRMPGAPDLAAFWRLLVDGVDAVGEVPADRWSGADVGAVRHGGYLEDIAGFDAPFFRISAAEADRMDPQQRLLLEVCWEALEDAGEVPARLRGSGTGVYIGVSTSEYVQRQLADPAGVGAYTATGGSPAMAAGRLAYLLDLHGPALAVDTACSSSLVAAHLAAGALRAGECERAIVAGVNVLLDPALTLGLARAGMLAPDGRCKTFDAAADGYVRGEGCGAVVLKPLSRARADGDRVYAVISGSAVNSDGASNGVTAPNPAAQRAVLTDAYRAAGIEPAAVGYIECHGTGTVLGDQIEARSIGAVLGGSPCLIGSVKTNVGHLESAAGIAGLIKTCLALHHATLPASLHLHEPNPHIPFDELGLEVVTKTRPWPGDDLRRAGVSSFGFSGTNAHLVLEAVAPARPARPDRPLVLPLSARTAGGLDRLRHAVAERIEADPASAPAIAYTAATRRTQHRPYRLAVAAADGHRLAERLRSPGSPRGSRPAAPASSAAVAGAPRVAYVFSGQGSQWAGMGRELIGAEPLFASTVRRCDEAVRDELGWSIVDALTGASPRDVDDTAVAQPLTVAVQVALARVLEAYGVAPVAVLGHSVGEISAAVTAGLLRLDAGMLIAARRGRAMADPGGEGAMLAVGLSRDEAEALCVEGVVLAAVNAPRDCVLSGVPTALAALRDDLVAAGTFSRWVPVRYAFHSPRMAPAADRLRARLADGDHGPSTMDGTVPMYSTVLSRPVTAEELDAAYWARGVRDTVDFAGSLAALVEELGDIDAVLEIGGHPALRAALRGIAADGAPFTVLHTLVREGNSEMSLLDALGQLYVLGCPVRWMQRHPDGGEVTSLPPYPWEHERHWIDPPAGHGHGGSHPLLGSTVEPVDPPARFWESTLDLARLPDLGDHRVGGTALLPAAGYAELARAAAATVGLNEVVVSALDLHHPLSTDQPTVVRTGLTAQGQEWVFEVHGRRAGAGSGDAWTRYANARLAPAPDRPAGRDLTDARVRCLESVPPAMFYDLLARQGLEYGATFRLLRDVWRTSGEAIGSVRTPTGSPLDDVAVLDAAVQLVAAAAIRPGDADASAGPAVPVGLDTATFWASPRAAAWAHARLRRADDAGLVADLDLVDEAGRPCVSLLGLRVRRSGPTNRRSSTQDADRAVRRYEVSWLVRDAADRRDPRGRWVILDDDPAGPAAALAERLAAGGATPVRRGAAVDPLDSEQVRRFVEDLGVEGPVAGLVCLWGLGEPRRDPAWLPAAVAHLVRALSFAPLGDLPRVLVATRGAQPVGPDGAVRDPGAATVWGLLKAAPIENPVLRVSCVDLDPADGRAAADALYAEICAHSPAADLDTEVGYRAGRRYVRRLTEAPDLCPVRDELALDPGGAYVVTGGTGGLGRLVAARLRERGAGLVAVLARGVPTANGEEEADGAGGRTLALRADVADEAGVRTALADVRARGKPIRGVVHMAGVLDDRALLDLTPQSLRTVLAPKVLGARHLDTLTDADPLDWFVLFASAAGVLGSPGQANYAAANAYLDALAYQRRTRGRPALTVDWGPWADVGMAAARRAETARQRRLRTGTSALDPRACLAELEWLILDGRVQEVVVPFDVRHLVQFYPASVGTSFFAEIAAEDMSVLKSIGVQSGARPDLDEPYVAPRNGIERRITGILQKALGIEPVGVHDSFFELGGDSVFGNQILVEINRALGVTIDPELAFQHLTAAHLTELAEAQLLDRLDQMGEDEAARLLASNPDHPQGSNP
jgi:acyl transferase domain-containing protein/acyl carrier protein